MLSRLIPNLPSELFDPINDSIPGAESPAFLNRCYVISRFSKDAARDLEASGAENELLEIVLDFLKNPTEEKTASGDLLAGFVGMIFEGHLLESSFNEEDFGVALLMAEDHFNSDNDAGANCFDCAQEKVIGMGMYAAVFTITQELINEVNRHVMTTHPNLSPRPASVHTLH